MQFFYIKQNAILPCLCVDLIEDGRHDFNKFHELIQNSTITFTMTNTETKATKIAKAPAYIKKKEDGGCVEKYAICYDWKKRDTKDTGDFIGTFEITFGDDIKNDNYGYPSGNLIMPIREELHIIIL